MGRYVYDDEIYGVVDENNSEDLEACSTKLGVILLIMVLVSTVLILGICKG